MGVNMAGFAIVDDEACREASRQEIIRRYFATASAVKKDWPPDPAAQDEVLMQSLGLEPEMRPAVPPPGPWPQRTGEPATAIELSDGTVITGKTSALMGASCAAMLNALKHLAGIADQVDLISPRCWPRSST